VRVQARSTGPSRRARQARLVATLVLVLLGIFVTAAVLPRPAAGRQTGARSAPVNGPTTRPRATLLSGTSSRGTVAIPAVEAGVMPWQLAAPISREVVVGTSTKGQLLIAGGLEASGSSAAGIFSLGTADGDLRALGSLALPTHDAAGALVGDQALVFGGGTTAPSATVQRFSATGTLLAPGSLPQARADATATTVGATAYIVGGYDGAKLDPQILSTSDGLHFRAVAKLPVPVRYAATASLKGKIYVFGGQDGAGEPVPTVQVINLRARSASVAGKMPLALAGAVAVNLDGQIYVIGGNAGLRGTSAEPVRTIYAFVPAKDRFLIAGHLMVAVSNAAAAVQHGKAWLVGGEEAGGAATAAVQLIEPNLAFGHAGETGAGSPYFGERLLVADRGNNRLLLLNDAGEVTWAYPPPRSIGPPGGFYFPDDAFFVRKGAAIISNQEENETIVELAFPSGRLIWSYGHSRVPGSRPGYLNNPDDAYLLKNGDVAVADPKNCRVLLISAKRAVLTQIGTPGVCVHNPPKDLGSPNGDTPLVDGDLLVSEINGSWVDELTTAGRLVWDVQLPIGYPSDPQQIGPDAYLVADYEDPGAIIVFNRKGRVLYRYQPSSGPAVLDRPSLVELLPSGVFMLNDDYNDRMLAVDPATGALVWQYGETGVPGSGPGLLNLPDGFDLLGPHGSTPTHSATG
jgi:hypothetical protein